MEHADANLSLLTWLHGQMTNLQVLEGALSATKARMEEMEGAKANLESQVTRLTTDLDDALSSQSRRSELEAKIAGLQQQLSALQPGPGSPHENDRRSNPDQGNEATASEPSPHHEVMSRSKKIQLRFFSCYSPLHSLKFCLRSIARLALLPFKDPYFDLTA